MKLQLALMMGLALLVLACGQDDDDLEEQTVASSASVTAIEAAPPRTTPIPPLRPGMTWQWQLQGELDTSYDVDIYDIDLFDTPVDQITALRDAGRIVICYFSAGSFEGWREDAQAFPDEAIGNTLYGWDDERWLDVRNSSVRAAMDARLALAQTKGCDGVEPDNVTAKNNDTGFGISANDQLDYNRFLADAAHERGLLVGLKNDLDQIPDLVDHFDFAVNEQCFQYDECDVYAPFIDAGKPVLNAEYDDAFVQDPELVCSQASGFGLSTVLLDVELDNTLRIEC